MSTFSSPRPEPSADVAFAPSAREVSPRAPDGVNFPVISAADDPTPSPDGGGPRSTPRVAFVDDEPALTMLADRAMPLYGCDAVAFNDPRDALLAITADPSAFDALITDHTMPGLTGVELAFHVRAIRPELPVVLTSGFLTPENRLRAEQAGVDTIVPKPCSMEDLAIAALTLLGSGGPSAGPALA